MSKFFEATMDNFHTHLAHIDGPTTFDKISGGFPYGFLYELPMRTGKCLVNVRVDKELAYMAFDVFPGINLANGALEPLVAQYCQKITPEVGSLRLECRHGEIYYHAESSFVENPVSTDTIVYLEKYAVAFLDTYFDALDALCHCKIPDFFPTWVEPEEDDFAITFLTHSIATITREIHDENEYNTISENIDAHASRPFLCEILSEKSRYVYAVDVNKGKSFLSLKLYPGAQGVLINPAYIHMASQFCNCASDEKNVGFLYVGTDSEGAYCKINVSLFDGSISVATLNSALDIMLSFLVSCKQPLELVSHGIISKSEVDEFYSAGRLCAKEHGDNLDVTSEYYAGLRSLGCLSNESFDEDEDDDGNEDADEGGDEDEGK